METNKPLQRAGYLLAFLLIVIPLIDTTMSVWPLRLSDERWRFGALGTLSNITLVPMLGILIALTIAVIAEHWRTRTVIGWICAVFAVGLAAFAVLFTLDYFQARTGVRPQAQAAVGIATTMALVKYFVSIVTLALLSRAGLTGPRKVVRVARPVVVETTPSPLIVGGSSRA